MYYVSDMQHGANDQNRTGDLIPTKDVLYQLSYIGNQKFRSWSPEFKNGAGDETRTRDPQLGRLMLYQLSYSRIFLIVKF